MADYTETDLKIADAYAEERERHQIEKALEFGARYSRMGYVSARRAGKSRFEELFREAFPGGEQVNGAYVVNWPPTHSGSAKVDWTEVIQTVKKALAEPPRRDILMHPIHAAQMEQYKKFLADMKAKVTYSDLVPEDTGYVFTRPKDALPMPCGCLTHPDRENWTDGDPAGCYCDCDPEYDTHCDHVRKKP